MIAAIVMVASVASAETNPEVQKHFELGNQYYDEGRYDDALVEYDKAYSLSNNWKILYNRGQALVMLRRDPEAIEAFEQYLARGAAEVPDDRRKAVEADLAKLRQRLANVTLEKAPPGLEVLVDGRPNGTTPLVKPIVVGAGKHTIALRKGSAIKFTHDILIAAGDSKSIAVEIAADPKPIETKPAPEETGLPAPAFAISLGIGVALPLANVVRGRLNPLGAIDFTPQWRAHPVWSIGMFLGGAAGQAEIKANEAAGLDIDPKGNYSIGIVGVRGQLHLLRDKYFDGWIGLDFGVWRETWRFNPSGPTLGGFEWASTSPAAGIVGGIDFPVSKTWALGGSARFFGTAISNGGRFGCASGDKRCNEDELPGGGGLGLRGVFEVLARVTWSIPYGGR